MVMADIKQGSFVEFVDEAPFPEYQVLLQRWIAENGRGPYRVCKDFGDHVCLEKEGTLLWFDHGASVANSFVSKSLLKLAVQ